MKAYVFPGQGAQFVGMGKELFPKYPEYVKQADAILGYSIEELCTVDSEEKLNLTQYTQPALFVVSALSYLDLCAQGDKPDMVAGHSLGEYNALFAAGAFSFETGVRLVKKRGELMGNANGGAMAAIVGMTEDQIRETIKEHNLTEVDISNLNTPKQTVIASTEEGIELAKTVFEAKKARFVPLKVSAAFHSRYMKEAQEKFAKYLELFHFSELEIPVISNYTALPYQPGDMKHNLIMQLGSTVRFVESVWEMEALGSTEFKEVGPGHTLTNMIRKIKMESDGNLTNRYSQRRGAVKEYAEDICSLTGYISESGVMKEETLQVEKTAYDIVKEWNQRYPVGTEISCKGYDVNLKTRTEAVVLFGHRAAVYMEGYGGYFDLREVRAV